MHPGAFIAWTIVVVILAGSLLYLMTRPHLRGDQKLVALVVSVSIALPIGGLLLVAILVVVLGALWETGITDAEALVILFGPLAVVVGIAIIVGGNVADRRESRTVAPGIDGPHE